MGSTASAHTNRMGSFAMEKCFYWRRVFETRI